MTIHVNNDTKLLVSLRQCLAYADQQEYYFIAAQLCQCIEKMEKVVDESGHAERVKLGRGNVPRSRI